MARTIVGRLAARSTPILVVLLATSVAAPPVEARAAPSEQRVRIEGRASTLFEGALSTDGHAVRATSDTQARRCDGTNNGAHPTPGPTPTAAADDAMRSAGMGFEGLWYPGFDDYFLQQFGPDRQDAETGAYWGILVNGIYTSVGGCQFRLNPGDQTLWAYDAFNRKDLLRLDGPAGIGEPTADVEGGPSTAAAQSSFVVAPGAPFVVTAVRNQATGDTGQPGYRKPAAGVLVAPVDTAANGVQTVRGTDPTAVATGADGRATLSWSTPGWKRIKADGAGFIRSNRLDVCVTDASGGGCGAAPPDAAVRQPPPSPVPAPKGPPTGAGTLTVGVAAPSGKAFRVGGLTVDGLRVTGDGNATGLVGVRWSVLGGGALRSWRLEYRDPRARRPRWQGAARGHRQTSALLDLPAGRTFDLRGRFTAPSGRPVVRAVGRVVVPVDDRVRSVRVRGAATRQRDAVAWRQTVTRLRRGGELRTRLAAGRPVLVVRAERRRAVIEVRSSSGRPRRLVVPGHADGRTVVLRGPNRQAAGTVRFRVRSGVVRVDGVAVGP